MDKTFPFAAVASEETESEGVVQFFEGESVPIPPGTKATYVPGQRSLRQTLALYAWPLAFAFALVAFLTGWLLGRFY